MPFRLASIALLCSNASFAQSFEEQLQRQVPSLNDQFRVIRTGAAQRPKEAEEAALEYGVVIKEIEGARCACILLEASRDGQSLGVLKIVSKAPEAAKDELEKKILSRLREMKLHKADIIFLPAKNYVYGYAEEFGMEIDEEAGRVMAGGQIFDLFDGKTKQVTLTGHPNNPSSLTLVVGNYNGSVEGIEFLDGQYSRAINLAAPARQ